MYCFYKTKKSSQVLQRRGIVVTENLLPSNKTATPYTFLPATDTHSLTLSGSFLLTNKYRALSDRIWGWENWVLRLWFKSSNQYGSFENH